MKIPFSYTTKQIDIPYLLKIGPSKLKKIGKYLFDKDMKNIALFLGENIEALVSDMLYPGFTEHKIEISHKQTVENVSVDDITHTAFNLSNKIQAIVGVGGGKALDFAKYCAYLLKLPFISVPTSMSNDGFCSPTSSLTVLGKRKSIKSGIPFGVVIDLDIIKSNPQVFLFSGIGDIASKITALWDWKEAFNKGLEHLSDFASMLSYNSLDLLFLKYSSDIYAEKFQRGLASSLLTSGIAMEVAGSSRPASGSEHLISHALDQILEKPKMHGIQVGVATYLCSLLQNNPNHEYVHSIFEGTGFFKFVSQDPFPIDDFFRSLKEAPAIKQNFYTILSEKDSFEKAQKLIYENPTLKSLIK